MTQLRQCSVNRKFKMTCLKFNQNLDYFPNIIWVVMNQAVGKVTFNDK